MRCADCYGYGEHCQGGKSAHPSNWYKCRACDGTGRIGPASPQPDFSGRVEVPSITTGDTQHREGHFVERRR